jgi:hypothetical protein
MISSTCRAQVDLLIRLLPHIAAESSLALKGGTAINLFERDMPRLSVDIDLTYLPFDDRATALQNISAALDRIKLRLDSALPAIKVHTPSSKNDQDVKLICTFQAAVVIVEVNTVLRGQIWPVRRMQIAQVAQDEFQKFAAIQVVSREELFGGKIVAALDRQHPRDLFDIHQLFAHEGIAASIWHGFFASLLSHSRPMHEIVQPRFQDQQGTFATQFAGMTKQPFSYADYDATRLRLVQEVHASLSDQDREFLLSFKNGEPDWGKFPVQALPSMPAVQWKLANIRKLKSQSPDKHARQLAALRDALFGSAS